MRHFSSRRDFSRLFFWLMILGGAWALFLDVTDGVSWQIGHLRLTSRDAFRPTVIAVACGALSVFLSRAWLFSAFDWLRSVTFRYAALVGVGIGVATTLFAIRYGAFIAGGADSYGYVSQADLWLAGHLRLDQSWFPADVAGLTTWATSPLGYRPGTIVHTIVPVYSPGLPLLMAAFKAIAGAQAPFYVVPLAGGVVVVATFLLGKLLFDEVVGLAAAALMAVSPAFLFQLMFPMSDVPVAAAWTVALVLAVSEMPLAAGLVSGLAVLIRPNLPLLAIAVGFIAARPAISRGAVAPTLRRTLAFGIGLLPAIVGVAVLYWYLYGSPFESGYGSLASIYRWEYLEPNLRRYGAWLVQSQTIFVIGAIAPLVFPRFIPPLSRQRTTVLRIGLSLFLVLLAGSYLFYLPFDEWWYLRFVLSGFPVLLVLATGALRSACSALASGQPARRMVLAAVFTGVLVLVGQWEVNFAKDHQITKLHIAEGRYADAGHDLARFTPASAVFLSMQHSGSLRYYSGRITIRYTEINPQMLDATLDDLAHKGFRPYIVLDDWEVPIFRERFASSAIGHLDWRPIYDIRRVVAYDPAARPSAELPVPR
jgi:hypothetical protein